MAEKVSLGDVVSTAKLVQKTFSRNSLTRMAKDSIFQFPMIMSADIPVEDATTIARAYEAYYAALMVSVISMRSDYKKSRFDNAGDYLKTFHQNSDLPNIFAGALRDLDVTIESAQTVNEYRKYVPQDVIMECWDTPDKIYNMDRLNSMYTPTTEAQRALEEYAYKIRTMQIPAMEARAAEPEPETEPVRVGDIMYDKNTHEPLYRVTKILADGIPQVVKFNNDAKNEYNGGGPIGAPTGSIKRSTIVTNGIPGYDENGNPIYLVNSKGKRVQAKLQVVETTVEEPNHRVTGQQAVINNKQLTALEPTLINLQLTSQDGATTTTHNVVVGVKAMINQVSSSIMVSNLIDGANDAHGIFSKFIQWSEGTRRFVKDMILGIADAKENARADKYAAKWIRTLQRRKSSNMLSRLGGGEVLPNTTIGCTKAEVIAVASACGTDLSDAFSAIKFLSKYYLLSFFIYDADEGKISVIFDGDTQFSITSVRNMKAKTDKGLDLTQFFEVMKIMGK